MCQTYNASAKYGYWLASKDAYQSPAISIQLVTSDDIVFPIMRHSDCNSPLADMLSPFNNTSMVVGVLEYDGYGQRISQFKVFTVHNFDITLDNSEKYKINKII